MPSEILPESTQGLEIVVNPAIQAFKAYLSKSGSELKYVPEGRIDPIYGGIEACGEGYGF